MSRLRVGVATCVAAPGLDEDGPLLMAALRAGGVDPHPAVWDDPMVDWGGFDVVLVRSAWDYPLRREAFLAWSRRCRRTANPREVLAWNTDKRYLQDLSRAAVPVVPTVFLPPGAILEAPADAFVVKPAVSGSAADTGRFPGGDASAAATLVDRLHAQQRAAMVQPYLSGIDVEGETSMVFLGGAYSHAVRRQPLLTAAGIRPPVVVADVLDTIRPAEVTAAQRAVAEAAVEAVPGGRRALTYARVDMIPGPAGPVVLELEATDCFLFLASATDDARRRMLQHLLDDSGAGSNGRPSRTRSRPGRGALRGSDSQASGDCAVRVKPSRRWKDAEPDSPWHADDRRSRRRRVEPAQGLQAKGDSSWP